MDPVNHTSSPTTTGTSVIGIKYKDGVIIASDMLGSYGSMARFDDIERIQKVNSTTVIANSGDIADFQYLNDIIKEKVLEDYLINDGHEITPKGLHCYITRVLYSRRTKMDPLWNSYIVGGYQNNTPFLGYTDMKGVAFEDKTVATGFGKFIALPKLRDIIDGKEELSEEEAKQAILDALTVLYYRDCRASRKYQLAIVNRDGVRVTGPHILKTNWNIAHDVSNFE